ncbi:MAG: PfkB family carbohydrate kinase [Phycisphaerae bacterium]
MSKNRQELAQRVGAKLKAAKPESIRGVVGFDGFVDEIIAVVDKRYSTINYDRIATITDFASRVAQAAGKSANLELVVRKQKLGGNGPIMANALAAIGLRLAYIGNLGYPQVHPVFQELANRVEVLSLGEPCHTDALEFDDGKLMLGKLGPISEISWELLLERVGQTRLIKLFSEAQFLGMVNWTMIPSMNDIWEQMIRFILPNLPAGRRSVFIDLADPEKRTREDVTAGLKLLTAMMNHIDVILGLNLKEAQQIAEVLQIRVPTDVESKLDQLASDIRNALKINTVVIHPRRGAAAATENKSASFAGPFIQQPLISTGAGDHFNAGFTVGRLFGFELDECLCLGTATSGYYVRHAKSPTQAELADFCHNLPEPEF